MRPLRSLAVLAASVGGLYLLAGDQPRPSPTPAAAVHVPVTAAPVAAPKPKIEPLPKLHAPAPIMREAKAKQKQQAKPAKPKAKRAATPDTGAFCRHVRREYERIMALPVLERIPEANRLKRKNPGQEAKARACLGW